MYKRLTSEVFLGISRTNGEDLKLRPLAQRARVTQQATAKVT